MSIITLTTDFGLRDWFVGTMKGVILNIYPEATIVDIAHDVAPGNIQAGAFAIGAAFSYFPKGTVHVGVVDPGVGSERSAVVVETEKYSFVGPDNGLFSYALRSQKIVSIQKLENPQFFLHPVSRTFHGRDVFAPAAAHLGRGVPSHRFGPSLGEILHLPWPEPEQVEEGWMGEVVYIDHFGNAITNLPESLADESNERMKIRIGNHGTCGLYQNYKLIPSGQAGAVFGSTGCLEIAVEQGNAAERFHLAPGTKIGLYFRSPN